MPRPTSPSLLSILCLLIATLAGAQEPDAAKQRESAKQQEAEMLSSIRQLTFEGRRAGEGYFDRSGQKMVFQSERAAGNPFFQIYLLDLTTGDVEQVSPGHGKTTCAWIHPSGEKVLYASTQEDPEAKAKQEAELKMRAEGKQRRYSWDYDEHYDLIVWDAASKQYKNLTKTQGYDAEGSWSPDGKKIAFASNRRAYQGAMSEREQEHFKIDPAYMMDIYIMDADGSNIQRLTETPGYDGGPFFSPDGQRICWRRFTPDGATAEIMSMKVDGSDKRQLTKLGAMSWAPYYHPSGKYLIFTTNRHGFSNFELYLVDAEGRRDPVRATYTEGFDGLPVFTPDGKQLAWTTNRTSKKRSQIFIANWDHEAALEKLGLDADAADAADLAVAAAAMEGIVPDYSKQDILRHVDYLCREELAGRMTGEKGERLATAYVAAAFDSFGLQPAGDQGKWFQPFDFTAGVDLGPKNSLVNSDVAYKLNEQWRPLSFSANGPVKPVPVVFAGYGIVAPAGEEQEEYDSYVHLDVKDKWVLCFRFLPEDVSAERRQHLARYASTRYKTMQARDHGARGLIFVSGPRSKVREQLIRMRFDGALSGGASLPVLSITDAVADAWLKQAGAKQSLSDLQGKLDSGEPAMGFELDNVKLGGHVSIKQVQREGRNVLGWLRANPDGKPTPQAVVVGAHVDHLGRGTNSSSLAKEDERGLIHFGADDNASGVACMLEMAQHLAHQQRIGKLKLKRDILFAAWSGEELGLIGSNEFVNSVEASLAHMHKHAHAHAAHAHAKGAALPPVETSPPTSASGKAAGAHKDPPHADPHAAAHEASGIYPRFAACINLDMVGRLKDKLILQGIGSSSIWRGEIERRNVPVGLPLTLQEDSHLPTDASSFYMKGVPILSAFTGSHGEYHTPRDTPDRLNYEGAVKIAQLMGLITRSVAMRDDAPDYIEQAAPKDGQPRAMLRAYLGTIPDYAEADVKGVKLSGVSKGGPASQGGLKGGDVIVQLAGKKIENIYDYTYAIEALKIGQEVDIVVMRGDKRLKLKLTPGSRE